MNNNTQDLLEKAIEQRADFIPYDELKNETSESDYFNKIINNLIGKKTVLIVGPRGCGKTHMMRYTSLLCKEDSAKPFAVYVSFNKYYRLEPLLTSKIDAIELFHSWMLAQILVSAKNALIDLAIEEKLILDHFEGFSVGALNSLITQLEKGAALNEDEQIVARKLSVSNVKITLENLRVLSGRKRIVLLFDDAALTLTPDYMKEFFDVFKNLKSINITPKASVYPGTTEYGARFHPTQEGELLPVWLSVEDDSYIESMEKIASKRISNFQDIPKDVNEYIKMASFGIPRAYLNMLQEYQNGDFKTVQQGLNRLIQQNIENRITEFKSISFKSPKLKNIIEVGEVVFDRICQDLKSANSEALGKQQKQIKIGISNIDKYPFVERMFNLLIEAGLLYEVPE
ncbi:zinc ribbon domain-containing protein, partial [Salmonella enterica subsp. enterica serovar Hvittingfoss]|nr:zinc ribbon domain-containing protein [Salmonella enterica subsp. enterica serovar Hvittingfoss]